MVICIAEVDHRIANATPHFAPSGQRSHTSHLQVEEPSRFSLGSSNEAIGFSTSRRTTSPQAQHEQHAQEGVALEDGEETVWDEYRYKTCDDEAYDEPFADVLHHLYEAETQGFLDFIEH